MPNYQTEARKKLEQQIQALEKSGLSKSSADYKVFIEKLKALNEATKEQYKKDSFGLDQELTPEKLSEFKNLYAECGIMGERLLEDMKALKGKPGYEVINNVNETLSKDMKVINMVDEKSLVGGTTSLQKIMDDARIRTVDLTGKNLGTVGANLSSRIPFNHVEADGHEMPGVFTANVLFDIEASYSKMINEVHRSSPRLAYLVEKYTKKFLEEEKKALEAEGKADLFTDGELKLEAMRQLAGDNTFTVEDTKENLRELVPEVFDKYTMFMEEDDINREIKAFTGRVIKFYNSNGVNNLAAKIKDKSRIDSRNSAMSTVADLLQVPNLICRAVPMKVVRDGEEIEGTFMSLAEGVDLSFPPLDVTNPEYAPDGAVFTDSNGLKDIADLQVLDFICGNVDRHPANMFYKFDNSSPDSANHKFTGVQGIDNDASFGTFVPKDENQKSNARLSSLNQMKVISKSMAKNVMSMDKEMLSFSLRNQGLTEAQVDAAGKRLDMLKNYINKSLNAYKNMDVRQERFVRSSPDNVLPGTVRIVDDNNFNKLSLERLGAVKGGTNSFTMVANFQRLAAQEIQKNMSKSPLEPEKIQEQSYYQIGDEELDWTNKVIRSLAEVTDGNRTSEQFKAIEAAAGRYKDFCEQNKGQVLSEDLYNIRRKHLKAISKAAKAYTDKKQKTLFKNSYTKKRIAAVNSILSEAAPKSREDYYGDIKRSMSKDDYKRYADGLHAYADRALDALNARVRAEIRRVEKEQKVNNMDNKQLEDYIFSAGKPSGKTVTPNTSQAPKKTGGKMLI